MDFYIESKGREPPQPQKKEHGDGTLHSSPLYPVIAAIRAAESISNLRPSDEAPASFEITTPRDVPRTAIRNSRPFTAPNSPATPSLLSFGSSQPGSRLQTPVPHLSTQTLNFLRDTPALSFPILATSSGLQGLSDNASAQSSSDSEGSSVLTQPLTALAVVLPHPEPEKAITKVIAICVQVLIRAFAIVTLQNTERVNRSCGSQSSRSAALTAQKSNVSHGKRAREQDEGSDDDEQHARKRIKGKAAVSGTGETTTVKPLACPFNKYDNALFGIDSPDSSYRVCSTWNAIGVHHLKQHLMITHQAPEFYCYFCCQDSFSSQQELIDHIRERSCERCDPPKYRERIGTDLAKLLNLGGRNARGTDPVHYWYTVFDALFPDERSQRTIDPYHEHGVYQRYFDLFLRFSTENISLIIDSVDLAIGGNLNLDLENRRMRERLQLDAIQLAVNQFNDYVSTRRMPHIGHQNPSQPTRDGTAMNNLGTSTSRALQDPQMLDLPSGQPFSDNVYDPSTTAHGEQTLTYLPEGGLPNQSLYHAHQPHNTNQQAGLLANASFIEPMQGLPHVDNQGPSNPVISEMSGRNVAEFTYDSARAAAVEDLVVQCRQPSNTLEDHAQMLSSAELQSFDEIFASIDDFEKNFADSLGSWDLILDPQRIDVQPLIQESLQVFDLGFENTAN